MLKSKEQKMIKDKAPFIDEESGLAIIKKLNGNTYSMLLLKLKFMCNAATLDIPNDGPDIMIFKPEEMLGILDLRSSDYYKIKQVILQQHLSKYYKFERGDTLCKHFSKFINTLKKKENKGKHKKIIHG